MDCLLEPIQCTKCFEQLKNPVVLPCGNAICEKHQNEDRDDNNSVYCSVCDLHHAIPNGGFVRMLALERLIKQQIDSIDMGKEYHYTYNRLRYFSHLYKCFEKLKNSPDDKVYSKISQLKSNIDLRREELKKKIDEDALKFIKKLDEYEAECKANIAALKTEIEKSEFKFKEWIEKLNCWQHQMRTFKKDTDVWKKIQEESSSKFDEMNKAYIKFHQDLFLNRLDDYEDMELFVGNDLDMIKNHSITYVVENVSQTFNRKNNEDVNFCWHSETFRAFGIDWTLEVKTSTNVGCNEAIKYVEVILYAEGDFSKETCDVSFDMIILHRTDPSKNIRKDNIKKHYKCSTGSSDHENKIIKLNNLIDNYGLFDSENDCFTVQVVIKSVEFKSIQNTTT